MVVGAGKSTEMCLERKIKMIQMLYSCYIFTDRCTVFDTFMMLGFAFLF